MALPPHQRRVALLRRWAYLLDSSFRIPATRIRFGWDAILGFVPIAGDLIAPVFSLVLLVHSVWLGLPRIIQLRMIMNGAIDAILGSIPILGDVFDIFWTANEWNLRLLERYSQPGRRPTWGDYAFVIGVFALGVGVVLIPLLVLWWLIVTLGRGMS